MERAAWPSDGLGGLVARAQPTLLHGGTLPSTTWRAHALWHDASHLAAVLPRLTFFARPAEADRSFAFFVDGGRTGMRAPPGSNSNQVTRRVMAVADFFEQAERGEEVLYCSTGLAELGAASSELEPLAPYEHAADGGASTSRAWLHAGRAQTHAHYDQSHNVHVQIVGRKEFTLWPPSAHAGLRFHPAPDYFRPGGAGAADQIGSFI